MLFRTHVKNGTGNCLILDTTTILHVDGQGVSSDDLIKKYSLENSTPEDEDHDYAALPVVEEISEYKEASINYIAGYIVKQKMKRKWSVLIVPFSFNLLTELRIHSLS